MRYFTDEDKAVWRDGCASRLVLGDPCAPVRIFFDQLDSWLQNIDREHPGLLQSEFGDTRKLLDGMKAAKAALSEYFFLPTRGSFEQFVRTTEIAAKRLLSDHFASQWSAFLQAARQRPDYSAIPDLITCLNRMHRRINSNAYPAAFTKSYPDYAGVSWENVRAVLNSCEVIPMEAVGMLCHSLNIFLLEQREKYGLNLKPGWWTDVAEGEFRSLTADEIIEAKKTAGIYGTSERVICGSVGYIIEQLFFQPPEEFRVHIVDIKDENNRIRHELTTEAYNGIRGCYIGNTTENRLFEIISYSFNAANTLAEMHSTSTALNERHKVRQQGTRRNQQKAEQVELWVISSARVLLDAYPALTITGIAEILASDQEREKIADQLANPEAQTQLRRAPPRTAGSSSIRKKLSAAIKRGDLLLPASKLAKITKT